MAYAIDQQHDVHDANLFGLMLDNLPEGAYFADRDRRIVYWNRRAESISGYSRADVVGHRCADNLLSHVDEDGICVCTSSACPLLKCLRGEDYRIERLYLHHKHGHRVPIRISAVPVRDESGTIVGGVETFHEVSTELDAIRKVGPLDGTALLCPLTGVGNHAYGRDYVGAMLREASREHASLGLIYLDLDDFRHCKIRFGQGAADLLLRIVARTLLSDLRAKDFVARWQDEEFVVVLPHAHPQRLERQANRTRALVEASSVAISEGRISATVSVGATMARPGETANGLLRRARNLMSASKRHGKNCVTMG